MPLIFQARSNPAGAVVSNGFHMNGSSFGSSCAKAAFSNRKSEFFSLPAQSFVAVVNFRPAAASSVLVCVCVFSPTLCAYRSTPWHPSPRPGGSRGIQPLGLLSPPVFTNPPVLLQHTEAHVHAHDHIRVFPRSHARFLFYWILFFFLIWGTRSGLMKFALHASCRWKVRASAFTSFLTFDITMS